MQRCLEKEKLAAAAAAAARGKRHECALCFFAVLAYDITGVSESLPRVAHQRCADVFGQERTQPFPKPVILRQEGMRSWNKMIYGKCNSKRYFFIVTCEQRSPECQTFIRIIFDHFNN